MPEARDVFVLPDVLELGLRIVFCGSAVGTRSAMVDAYYAHPRNRFWQTLHQIGLTPRLLAPLEYSQLPRYGIGLTDLCKAHSGGDTALPGGAYDAPALSSKLAHYRPVILAFNGKTPAKAFFGTSVDYGLQVTRCGETKVYVLPSTSTAASRYWDETYWRELAADSDI